MTEHAQGGTLSVLDNYIAVPPAGLEPAIPARTGFQSRCVCLFRHGG